VKTIMHKVLLGILILSISFHKNTAFFNVTLSDDKLTVNGQEIKNTTKVKKLLVDLAVSGAAATLTYNLVENSLRHPYVKEGSTSLAIFSCLAISEILASNNRKKKIFTKIISCGSALLAGNNTYMKTIIKDPYAFGISLGKVAGAITDGNGKKAIINVARTCGEQVGVHCVLKNTGGNREDQCRGKALGNAVGGNCAAALAAQALEGPELRNTYLAKAFVESIAGLLINRSTDYCIKYTEKLCSPNSDGRFSPPIYKNVQEVAGKWVVPVVSNYVLTKLVKLYVSIKGTPEITLVHISK
jgi:hypothetical protein